MGSDPRVPFAMLGSRPPFMVRKAKTLAKHTKNICHNNETPIGSKKTEPHKQESAALLCAGVSVTSQTGRDAARDKRLASGYRPGNLTSNQAECKRETWGERSSGCSDGGSPMPLIPRSSAARSDDATAGNRHQADP